MTNWNESSGHYPQSNGSGLELGLVLGRLVVLTEQQITLLRAQTEILEDVRENLDAVPHRIAEKIPKHVPAKARLSYVEILDLIRRTGLCLLPISLVLLVVTGKLSMIEAVTLMRQAFGVVAP